jgi:hypothetical protein
MSAFTNLCATLWRTCSQPSKGTLLIAAMPDGTSANFKFAEGDK